MAHTKAKGSSKLGRDSKSKRLGVKIFGGQKALAGQIIIRQRGSKFFSGPGTAKAADDSLYAKKDGTVTFKRIRVRKFSNRYHEKALVSVS